MIGLAIWATKAAIKLTILAFIASAYMAWLMIALPVMLVASIRGHQRMALQWRRSLTWKMPRHLL